MKNIQYYFCGWLVSTVFIFVALASQQSAQAQSPSTIAGRTFQLTISSGTAPFASSGVFRFLPSAMDNAYAIVKISGSINNSSGTYSYTKTGSTTATLRFDDSITGSGYSVACTFTTANSGSYLITNPSFPSSLQSGTFLMYAGQSPTSIAGSTVTATISSGVSPFASSGSFQFLPGTTGSYQVIGIVNVANSSGTYTYFQNSPTTGQISFTDSVAGAGYTHELSFDTSTSGTYYLRSPSATVYQTGVFTIAFPVPPTISAQPLSRTNTVGSGVTFNVTATGTAPLNYQWLKNGTNIGSAVGFSYSIGSVQTNDAGSYTVFVSNAGGSITSDAATLTVSTTATIRPVLSSPLWTPANGFSLNLATQNGFTYRVQTSTNLIQWTDWASFTGNGSAKSINDGAATNLVRRFYRVVSP